MFTPADDSVQNGRGTVAGSVFGDFSSRVAHQTLKQNMRRDGLKPETTRAIGNCLVIRD
jgi:hypothetical protein